MKKLLLLLKKQPLQKVFKCNHESKSLLMTRNGKKIQKKYLIRMTVHIVAYLQYESNGKQVNSN